MSRCTAPPLDSAPLTASAPLKPALRAVWPSSVHSRTDSGPRGRRACPQNTCVSKFTTQRDCGQPRRHIKVTKEPLERLGQGSASSSYKRPEEHPVPLWGHTGSRQRPARAAQCGAGGKAGLAPARLRTRACLTGRDVSFGVRQPFQTCKGLGLLHPQAPWRRAAPAGCSRLTPPGTEAAEPATPLQARTLRQGAASSAVRAERAKR